MNDSMKNTFETIARYCEKLLIVFLIATVVIVPLFFDIRLYSVFDLSKVTVLYLLTTAIVALWIILVACKHDFKFSPTAIDIPILAYLGIFIVSSILSINPLMSLFGTYKRFEGLTATVCYLFLFYTTVYFITTKKRIYILVTSILASAILSSCYGIAQHHGYDMFKWSSFEARRVFSTFGNPVFFAAYLVMVLPLTVVCFLSKFSWQRNATLSKNNHPVIWIFYLVSMIVYTAFWFTNTRACFVALFGSVAPLFIVIYRRPFTKKHQYIILVISFVLIGLFFNVKHETSGVRRFIEHFVEEDVRIAESPGEKPNFDTTETPKRPWIANKIPISDSTFSRIFQYLAAICIVKDYPALGIGPDTIGIVYQKYLAKVFSVQENDGGFWFPRQDRIHNDILDTVVTRGIFGLGTYVWVLWAFGRYMGKNYTLLHDQYKLLLLGLLSGILSYLIQNEFSFGNTPIVSLFWVMMGLCISLVKLNETEKVLKADKHDSRTDGNQEFQELGSRKKGWHGYARSPIRPASPLRNVCRWLGCGFALVVIGFSSVFILRVYRADAYFEYGRRIIEYEKENLQTVTEKGVPFIRHAVFLNPYETFYRDELCRTYIQVALKTNHEAWIQKAYVEANNTLRLIPEHFMGFFHLGMVHQFLADRFGRNTIDSAIVWYEKAIDADPFQSIFHSNLASAYTKKGNLDQAIEELRQAYLIRQDDLNVVDRLTNAYLQKGDLEHAVIFARKTVKLNPAEAGYYNNLGAILSKKGMHEEAIHAFKKAIEMDTKEPVYMENLAKLYLSAGKYEESMSCYEKLITLNPSVADYHNNLGVIYQKEKQPDTAVQSFQKAVALKPDNPIYTYNLADTFANKGQYADAKQILQTFTKTYPNHAFANIHVLLANLYLKNAAWDKVAYECEQAIKIDEKSIAAYKLLGNAYYTMHQYELAEKTAKKTLALNPGDQETQDLLVKISNKIRR
ncbi:MAG: hypothetical protein CV087_08190 [Candidatus Brocadia sp. WS118]|nr:MAG: hypothetical protein CV087_08190 [Candidatus Brocadia sp. WS118]